MTDNEGVGFEPTPEQRDVVTAAWDSKQLVTARAGAGKTTTLCRRIDHLVTQCGIAPAKIIVLTFSRAAVRKLRAMLRASGVDSWSVQVRTFDAWALGLLLDAGYLRDDLFRTSFDERISLAAEAVEEDAFETGGRLEPAHVIIDEVQDLIGVRRDMVEALLDRFPGMGFTIVGDSAQSIYGFQVSEPAERSEEIGRFVRWLHATYGGELVVRELTDNFRATEMDARVALAFGPRLQRFTEDANADVSHAESLLRELRGVLLTEVPVLGALESDFARDTLQTYQGTTLVLCRDNAEVLLMSERLRSLDIPHSVQQSSRGAGAAPTWLAGLLNAIDAAVIDQPRFDAVVGGLTTPYGFDRAEAWRSLRALAPSLRNRLDLDLLRRAVADGRIPDELAAGVQHRIVVSTVHRAKGLEFDRTLLVGLTADSPRAREVDAADEARLLYVAMTRSREDMYRLEPPDSRRLRKGRRLPKPVDRWFVGGYPQWVRAGVEIVEADVCHETPPGTGQLAVDPIATQKYLHDFVQVGDEVEVRRLHDLPLAEDETPPYEIVHKGTPIGELSRTFRHDLWRLLKQSATFRVTRWPCRVTGLRVECLEAVVGVQALTSRHGLGSRGIWTVPRLSGLGRFDWTHAEQVPEGHDHP